ncbi:MAG: AMP-binding protein [Thermodesulfobacteriota bacterium]|nr:AMP-binding protein [Thermodesulfobacteriota bacterium]
MTLVEMLKRNATLHPEKTAMVSGETKVSYKTFYERTNALGNYLVHIGLEKGQRVGLLLQKTPEVIISFLGAATAGGIVFPIDYNQTLANIQFILDLTDPSVLIVDESYKSMLSKLQLPCSDEKIIMVGRKSDNTHKTLDEIFQNELHDDPHVFIENNDIVYLNFTSGTTGRPKGAITTHANIYWNTLSAIESLNLTHDDVHLCMFPVFSHPHELFARPLYLGGTIVLTDSISPKSIAKVISEHRVTCMMAVASIYDTLVRIYDSSYFDFSSLRMLESGGMHMNPTLVKKLKECFHVSVIPVWGSTETSGIAVATPIDHPYRAGSMGKSCPYYEVQILSEDGEEMPPNEIGEMAVKGPGVCSGYYNQPDETDKCLKDGYFLTGDMVRKNSDGYLYFASRKAGMMKVAGLKVSPTEIEDVLIDHPDIAEVAVVKTLDHSHGEVPRAVIVPKVGMNINKADIRKFCEERLSRYKVPRVIEFRTELPKGPGGKILYRQLWLGYKENPDF